MNEPQNRCRKWKARPCNASVDGLYLKNLFPKSSGRAAFSAGTGRAQAPFPTLGDRLPQLSAALTTTVVFRRPATGSPLDQARLLTPSRLT